MKGCYRARRLWAERAATGLAHGDPFFGNTAYRSARITSLSTQSGQPHYGFSPNLAAKPLISRRRSLNAQKEDLT